MVFRDDAAAMARAGVDHAALAPPHRTPRT
jgi:hypothetical protein